MPNLRQQMESVIFEDWGRIGYREAWERQEALMAEALAIKQAAAEQHAVPKSYPHAAETRHHLIFCEHPHVYTLGKSGHESNLLADEETLRRIEASYVRTNRGGDITYHGPGQLVGYPVLDLEKFFTDLGRYMRSLEEVIIRTIAHYGLRGERLAGATGVWIDAEVPGRARKICAMGVRCSRWITLHGFALNANTDLDYFSRIVPCGITDKGVTSIQAETGRAVDMEELKSHLRAAFEAVFETRLVSAQITLS